MHGRFLLLVSSLVLGCTKSESPPQPAPAASSVAAASATPSAAPAASAEGTASAAPAASASAAPAADAPKKSASGTASAAASSEPVNCGTKPLPDCPLQAWMKSNMNPPVMTGDLAGLQKGFEKVATFAPPGYSNWTSIAKDAAAAAKSGDLTAAKAACRTCHDQYKPKYRAEMRGRKI